MKKQKEKERERKLSPAEQKRKAAFEQLKAEMKAQGYEEHDLTVGLVYANVMAVVVGIPLILVFAVIFFRRHQTVTMDIGLGQLVLFWVLFLVLIVAHELIHGIFWAIFAKKHWNAISFGFIAKYCTPYCTCNEPLKKSQYIVGALMPTILLGILPAIIAICNGSHMFFLLGMALILGGGGDITIILKLLAHRPAATDIVYIDHPCEAGLVAFVHP